MFRTSAPVTAAGFLNRTQQLEALMSSFVALAQGAPRWIALLGPRKIGKTSLLLEAARRTEGVHFTVIDALEQAPLSLDFFRVLVLRVLDALVAQDVKGSLSRCAHDPAAYRALLYQSPLVAMLPPALLSELDRLPSAVSEPNAVRRWLQLPEELAAASGRYLAVAIDEIQELSSLESRRFEPFPVMRATWQRHKHVSYIISGSAPSMLRELVSSRHSPFFMHFQLMELHPFSERDAIELLVGAAPPGRRISKRLAKRIFDVVGGHPFYLQMLGESLVTTEPPYDEQSLKPVLQSLLFSRTGRLSLYFENEHRRAIGKAATLAATLQAVAERGPVRLTDVARAIKASTASTARYLERLGDVIRRDGEGLYHVADPLMALWLRWRAPGGTAVPMTVIGNEAEIAVARHLAALGFDLVYQSRASRGAFDLLAIRGGDQLGLQVKRSELPLRFRKSEWSRMGRDAERWGWHWAIAAVDEAGGVRLLDPAGGRVGREIRLGDEAAIDNLLRWIDGAEPR